MICRKCLEEKDESGFQRYITTSGNKSIYKTCKSCRLKTRKLETRKANWTRANKKRSGTSEWNLRMREYRAHRRASGNPIIRNCKSDKYRIVGRFKFLIRAEVFRLYGSQCQYCKKEADTIDHVIPLARGGSNDISNLVPACRSCNSSKQAKLISEWRPSFQEVQFGHGVR